MYAGAKIYGYVLLNASYRCGREEELAQRLVKTTVKAAWEEDTGRLQLVKTRLVERESSRRLKDN